MGQSVRITKQDRGKLVHVEAPGCIVNIRVGLSDYTGRDVTSIEVIADGDRYGEPWWIVTHGNRRKSSTNIRVRRDR